MRAQMNAGKVGEAEKVPGHMFVSSFLVSACQTTLSALPSTLTAVMDQVVRKFTFDIFGNSVTYTQEVRYGDRRQYTHKGPVGLFDACFGLRISLVSEFRDDGHLRP
jgi:hypothetical protein